MLNTTIIPGQQIGSHIVDGPLTTTAVKEVSPELLKNEIDTRVVRIRPMATPVDQISRMIGSRPAASMVVDYYSVDTRPVSSHITKPAEAVTDQAVTGDDPKPFLIHTANDRIFAPTDTLMIPQCMQTQPSGNEEPLILYINEVVTGAFEGLKVTALNQTPADAKAYRLPNLTEGLEVVRMGRAASELDVQTSQFEALPVKEQNYCQIFKTQVEQSAFVKISAKEVGWTFSDQEEVAIMDMRLGMEKSFLFGTKARIVDPLKYDAVLFTRGIWNQAGSQYDIALDDMTQDSLLDLMKAAFTGDASGSTRKILIGGADLILAINKLESTKVILSGDTITHWGIDFNEIRSKFGTLCVIHSEVFDQCGHKQDGMIIDPQFLTKYCHVPFRVEHLDLKRSGLRNTEALVATEASCLVLRHPKTHFRITGSWNG